MPNISWGPPVIASLRKHVPDAFLDCHMMVAKPSQWVADTAKAGGSRYTFHLEAVGADDLDLPGICKCIRDNGMQVGIAIKPGTGVDALTDVISLVDMVLVMTVEPGERPPRNPSSTHSARTPSVLTAHAHTRVRLYSLAPRCDARSLRVPSIPADSRPWPEPGFGGQSFMPHMMPKVLSLRTAHPTLDIQVPPRHVVRARGHSACIVCER